MHTTEVAATPDSMPLEHLEAQITELAGHLAAGEARWLGLVAAFDRRRGYESWGCRSTAAWLGWHCGLDERAARERVRVARSLEDLPVIASAFAAGRLSYSKVRALVRVAGPSCEADLVMLAEHATAAQVERIVRAYRASLDAQEARVEANATHARRFVRLDACQDGTYVLTGRLTAEQGALVRVALDAARDASGPAEPPEGATSEATTNADALVAMAETLLATGPRSRRGGERHLVVVDVDAEVLEGRGEGRCELDGARVAPETARRLACDASVVTLVRDEAGQPVAMGERRRSIPVHLRRAVRARDGGCRFPACGGRRFVDVHHVRHRARGGEHSMGNLVTLCWFHHRLVNEGGWGLRVHDGGVVAALRPDGAVLATRRGSPGVHRGRLEDDNRSAGVAVGPGTCVPRWSGERLDLDHVLTALWCAADQATASRSTA